MKPTPRLVPVEPAHHAVYQAASRWLKKKIGATAPDVAGLINHELSRRKSRRIAEEYLYFVGWYDPAPSKPTRPG